MILPALGAALSLTLAVELPLARAFFVKAGGLGAVLLANLLTNPALNLLLTLATGALGRAAYAPALAALECAAVLAEAGVFAALCGIGGKRALWMSLALNAASFAAGLLAAPYLTSLFA